MIYLRHSKKTFIRNIRNAQELRYNSKQQYPSSAYSIPSYGPLDTTRLYVLNSPYERCGVHEYGTELNHSLMKLGIVIYPRDVSDLSALYQADPTYPILIHMEPSLLPGDFDQALSAAVSRTRVIMCCHYFDSLLATRFARVNRLITHRDYGVYGNNISVIPMGCPNYLPVQDKLSLRKQYMLPEQATIITTAGFLTPWKRICDAVEYLIPKLESNMCLQLLCSQHFSGTTDGWQRLESLIRGTDNVIWLKQFISQQELLDRMCASDMGFLYHGIHTGSVSAVTKQFVSARCPLVINESNHSSDVYVERVNTMDITVMLDRVLELSHNKDYLSKLTDTMNTEYERLQMNNIAKSYLDVLRSLQ